MNKITANSESKTPYDAEYTSQVLCKRVTELRKNNDLTLKQLAELSGVSRSMLSQIERGQANPTLAVAFRIAQAFGMGIGELVGQPSSRPSIDVVRHDDAKSLFRSEKDCHIRTLSPLHMEKSVEFYEIVLGPQARLESSAHYEGAKELFTVVNGTALIESDTSESQLAEGDSAHYSADVSHCISNTDKTKKLVGYLVVTYP